MNGRSMLARRNSELASESMKPKFFPSPAAWHAWLEEHHETHEELWVGFHKVGSGNPASPGPSLWTGPFVSAGLMACESRWMKVSYVIRFTPRRPRSVWSAINIRRVAELTQPGSDAAQAGLEAFERRTGNRSEIYAYEQRKGAKLSGAFEKQFRANKKAWKFFLAQPPWYQRTASWWVISAKKEETRMKRLAQLIEDSEHERTIRELSRTK